MYEVCNHFREIAAWSRKSFFLEKKPLKGKFLKKMFPKGFTISQKHVLYANFVKIGWPEIGKVVRCLPDKKQNFPNFPRSPALASARIAPNMCQGQLQATYSEFPKFHPNPFTSGGVIAERVNVVETRHKVFSILAEASSPSTKISHLNSYILFGSVHCSRQFSNRHIHVFPVYYLNTGID